MQINKNCVFKAFKFFKWTIFFKKHFFSLLNVHYSSSKLERILTLIIKIEKGIEIDEIHFYNMLEHI
jgi:hypothetical protein